MAINGEGGELIVKEPISRYSVSVEDTNVFVSCLSFCPFEGASNLLLYGLDTGKINILSVELDANAMVYAHFESYLLGSQICALAWSPQLNLASIPQTVKIAVATLEDKKIKLIEWSIVKNAKETSGMVNSVIPCISDNSIQDFINDIAFEPVTGDILASVGDDNYCYLWSSKDGLLESKLRLTSSGTSVKWHPSEPNKILVAERKGLIRFYNLETKKPVMSFVTQSYPLLSADWCPQINLLIGAVAGNQSFFWDTSISSQPFSSRKSHPKGAQKFKFFNEYIFATRGRPKNQIQVENCQTNQVLLKEEIQGGRDITWNLKTPILAVGGSNKIFLFKFNVL